MMKKLLLIWGPLARKWKVGIVVLVSAVAFLLPVLLLSPYRPLTPYSLCPPADTSTVGEITKDRVIEQTFISPVSRLRTVTLSIGTYARSNTGHMDVSLVKDGTVLTASSLSLSDLQDNHPYQIVFDAPVYLSVNERYSFVITAPESYPKNAITLCSYHTGGSGANTLYINGEATGETLNLQLNGNLFEFCDPFFWVIFALFIGCVAVFAIFYQKIFRPRYVLPALILFLFVLFFRYSIVLTWDSAHYLSFLPILNGAEPIQSWDVVRGPVFPAYLWLTGKIFGTSADAMLLVQFGVYMMTLGLYYLIAVEVLNINSVNKKLLTFIAIVFLVGLNPLFFGYFHVMLTEYLSCFLVALSMYCYVIFYKRMAEKQLGKSYYFSLAVLVILCPVFYMLKQSFAMISIGATLAVVLLSILQRRGARIILRTVRLLAYTLAALAVSISVWNQILPEPTDDYMKTRTSGSIFSSIFVRPTEYIQFAAVPAAAGGANAAEAAAFLDEDEKQILLEENPEYMLVTFRKSAQQGVCDAYVFPGTNLRKLPLAQSTGIFWRNVTSHPVLVLNGIVDAYLATINFYDAQSLDSVDYYVIRDVSLIRATENDRIGSYVYYPPTFSNVYYLSPDLAKFAAPFYYKKTAGTTITDFFTRLHKPTNLVFTVGFLLLPFLWLVSIVMAVRKKNESIFALSAIISSFSFGYMLLLSLAGAILDRYAFTVFIPTWIAILMFFCGAVRILKARNKAKAIAAAEE